MDVNPLYRDADLTCVIKSTFCQGRNGCIHIGFLVDDDRCGTTMFKGTSCSRSQF